MSIGQFVQCILLASNRATFAGEKTKLSSVILITHMDQSISYTLSHTIRCGIEIKSQWWIHWSCVDVRALWFNQPLPISVQFKWNVLNIWTLTVDWVKMIIQRRSNEIPTFFFFIWSWIIIQTHLDYHCSCIHHHLCVKTKIEAKIRNYREQYFFWLEHVAFNRRTVGIAYRHQCNWSNRSLMNVCLVFSRYQRF